MRKLQILWILGTAAVMLLLPWLGVSCVPPKLGMGAVLVLFFGIDPVYSIAAGYAAGKNLAQLWWLPALSAGLFLAGAWLCFAMGEPAFLLYAGIYWFLGSCVMLICGYLEKKREKHG